MKIELYCFPFNLFTFIKFGFIHIFNFSLLMLIQFNFFQPPSFNCYSHLQSYLKFLLLEDIFLTKMIN